MPDLSELFDYDLWATRRWLLALPGLQDLGRAHEILEHMLFAQKIWLERLGVEVPNHTGNIPIGAVFENLNRLWKHVVEEADLNTPIVYHNLRGEEFTSTVGDIAYHVINHGTYHRGHLRGLAETENNEGFPDTDLILYLRE